MYKQDNEKHYTWNPKWHQKYESIWGLWEKFRYVNVPDETMNCLIGYTKSSKEYSFNKDLLCYQKAKRDITLVLHKYLNKDIIKYEFLRNKVHNLHLLFYDNLRYCPECIKYGYHSFYHQLRFLDNCFVHQCKLVNRCNCKYGYVMQYKNVKWEAFQCMECNKKPENLPAALDGISINWKMPINFKIKCPPSNIQRILCVDSGYELTGDKQPFTHNQSVCLRNIFFNRRMEECKAFFVINKCARHNRIEICNMAEIIQNELFEKYGIEYCKKQFDYVQRFHKANNLSVVNPEIIALFYIIQELRYSKYIDRIYPVEFGVLEEQFDYKYNIYWDVACKWRMYYCDQRYKYMNSQATQWIDSVSNFIYEKIVRCRYQEIVEYLKNNQNIEYFSEQNISYNAENYPTFVIVNYFNSMDKKVEVY